MGGGRSGGRARCPRKTSGAGGGVYLGAARALGAGSAPRRSLSQHRRKGAARARLTSPPPPPRVRAAPRPAARACAADGAGALARFPPRGLGGGRRACAEAAEGAPPLPRGRKRARTARRGAEGRRRRPSLPGRSGARARCRPLLLPRGAGGAPLPALLRLRGGRGGAGPPAERAVRVRAARGAGLLWGEAPRDRASAGKGGGCGEPLKGPGGGRGAACPFGGGLPPGVSIGWL